MLENKAIGFTQAIDLNKISYEERNLEIPELEAEDVLVKVKATAINPVDTKMQASYQGESFRILGFDAVGEIIQVGRAVTRFNVGDRVYYAGQQNRQGSNQTYQVVNSQLIALAPANLNNLEVAALPLTAITAGEILTDNFNLSIGKDTAKGKKILIINGAGGVGSILIQLAKMMGMFIVTTASRTDSREWVKQLGADQVLNHREDMAQQLLEENLDKFDYIAMLHSTDDYWDFVLQHIAPFGKISSIVETKNPINMGPLKNMGAQFSWEFMFAKGNYGFRMEEQGDFLTQLAEWVEQGLIRTTFQKSYQGFSIQNLEAATQDVVKGDMIGKVAIDFEE